MAPAASFGTTLASVAAGRAAVVAERRGLADRLEALSLADTAEILLLLEPVLADLRGEAMLVLERAAANT
jgi:hypothetical protein